VLSRLRPAPTSPGSLPTLGGRPIEEAALYIGRRRIGTPGQPRPLRNRGLVILFVPDKSTTADPNFRIEVGNGPRNDHRLAIASDQRGDARGSQGQALRRGVYRRLAGRGEAGA
jgi:hypothetical protein